MAVRAHHLALGHFLQYLRPRFDHAYQNRDRRHLLTSDVVPVQAPRPGPPPAVRATAVDLNYVVLILHINTTLPRWRKAFGSPCFRESLLVCSTSVASRAPRVALRKLRTDPISRHTQSHKPTHVSNLDLAFAVIRVDGAGVPVTAVDTALRLPLVHNALQPGSGLAKILGAFRPATFSSRRESPFAVSGIVPTPTVPLSRAFLLSWSPPLLCLSYSADDRQSAEPPRLPVECGCRMLCLTPRTPNRSVRS